MKNGSKKDRHASVASIHTANGRLVLPADTPYAREIVLEYAEHSARLHGRAKLEIAGHAWLFCVDERGRIVMSYLRRPAPAAPVDADPPGPPRRGTDKARYVSNAS